MPGVPNWVVWALLLPGEISLNNLQKEVEICNSRIRSFFPRNCLKQFLLWLSPPGIKETVFVINRLKSHKSPGADELKSNWLNMERTNDTKWIIHLCSKFGAAMDIKQRSNCKGITLLGTTNAEPIHTGCLLKETHLFLERDAQSRLKLLHVSAQPR